MKRILKFVVVFSIIFTPINVCANSTDEYLTADLLENSQPNEIVLNTKNNTKNSTISENPADKIDTEEKPESQISEEKKSKEAEIDSVMDNSELDFEFFKIFDQDNDNVIDEDTIVGKIYHSKITRTDIPSFLLKEELTHRFQKGPVHKIQAYGGFRGSLNSIFTPNYSTDYDNLTTQVGMYGKFNNPNYRFKIAVNPIPRTDSNYLERFISDAYLINTSIPHHQIMAGYSRVQTGIEGGTSSYILPFVARSQIARNFGSARSLGVKILGNYNYIDYNIGVGSSGRYITSGMPGMEFTGWMNVKPFGSEDKKFGKLTLGGGFNGGHNGIDYSVGSVYVGYKHKKLWANFEAGIADGYSGSKGVSANKASGYAFTAGWKFNPQWQLIGRIDQFDPNRDVAGDLKREYTIGVNWFIKGQALKIVLNYVFCENQNRDDSHKIILATQILL